MIPASLKKLLGLMAIVQIVMIVNAFDAHAQIHWRAAVGDTVLIDAGRVDKGGWYYCNALQSYGLSSTDTQNFFVNWQFNNNGGNSPGIDYKVYFVPKSAGHFDETVKITLIFVYSRQCDYPNMSRVLSYHADAIPDSGCYVDPRTSDTVLTPDTAREICYGAFYATIRNRSVDTILIDHVRCIAPDTQSSYSAMVDTSLFTSGVAVVPPFQEFNLRLNFVTNNGPVTSVQMCPVELSFLRGSARYLDTVYLSYTSGLIGTQFSILPASSIGFTGLPYSVEDTTVRLIWTKLVSGVSIGGWAGGYPAKPFSFAPIDSSKGTMTYRITCRAGNPLNLIDDNSGALILWFDQRLFNGSPSTQGAYLHLGWNFDPKSVKPSGHLKANLNLYTDTLTRFHDVNYGRLRVFSPDCKIDTTLVMYNAHSSLSNESATMVDLAWDTRFVGEFDDTINVYAALSGNGCPLGDAVNVPIHLVILTDTFVQFGGFWNQAFGVSAFVMQPIGNLWEGQALLDLYNNVPDTTIWRSFAVRSKYGDSIPLRVLDTVAPFAGYTAPPFDERWLKLIIQSHKYQGFDTVIISAVINHRGKDSTIYSVPLPVIWTAASSVEANSTGEAVSVLPNPFVSEVEAYFSLTEPSPVTLYLYDVLGREVRRVETDCSPGANHVALDGSKLPPGAYWYVARCPDWVSTGKLLKK